MTSKADFIRLFMPVQGDLMAYVLSAGVAPEDADDVLQNAALQIYDKIEQFSAGTNFRAWAFAFVRNEVLRQFRKSPRRALSLDESAFREIEAISLEDDIPSVRVSTLNRCLEKLQGTAKSLLLMRYRDGLDVRAIAGRLKRPVESVYVTLSRVRKALQECIDRSGPVAEGTS